MNLFGILPCNAFCHIYFFDGGGVECICRGTSPCVSTVGGTYVGVCGGCGLGILTGVSCLSIMVLFYMVVAKEYVAFGMEKFSMFSLTVHANLKHSVRIFFCQGIINNQLSNRLVFIRKRANISLNIEIRKCMCLPGGLIVLQLRFLTYK